MTLSTDFIIRDGTGARAVFEFCQDMLTATDEQHRSRARQVSEPIDVTKYEWRRNPGWENVLGQGLPAILEVTHGPDGPLIKSCSCEPDYKCGDCMTPDGFIKVNWDTAYGYQGPNGIGCTDLHSLFIRGLGAWCDVRNLRWSWENEYTGEWHDGTDGLSEFGVAGEEAMDWFRTVAPALAAMGAKS